MKYYKNSSYLNDFLGTGFTNNKYYLTNVIYHESIHYFKHANLSYKDGWYKNYSTENTSYGKSEHFKTYTKQMYHWSFLRMTEDMKYQVINFRKNYGK